MRVQKKLDGEGGGRSMQNLQGRAGGITLVWLREEKAAVGDRAMTCYTEKVVLKGSGHACSPQPMCQGRFMVQTLLLQQAEVGNPLRWPCPTFL